MVLTLRNNSSAISPEVFPEAMRHSTWNSLSERALWRGFSFVTSSSPTSFSARTGLTYFFPLETVLMAFTSSSGAFLGQVP